MIDILYGVIKLLFLQQVQYVHGTSVGYQIQFQDLFSSFSYLSYGLIVKSVDKVRIRSANVHRFTLRVLKEICHLPDQVIRLSKSECRQ